MKKIFSIIVFLFIVLFTFPFGQIKAQDIEFIPRDTLVSDTLGSEMVIYVDIINVSSSVQTVFVVRT